MDVLSVSAALQIAGRAGRYGTVWDTVSIIQFNSINITKKRQCTKKCEVLKYTFRRAT